MKRNLKIGLILTIVVVLLLALTGTAMAGKRSSFEMEFDFDEVDPTHYHAYGDFSSIGAIEEDEWDAYYYWKPGDAKQPTMILYGENGNIAVNITVTTEIELPDCEEGYEGVFSFGSLAGTEDYYALMGTGRIETCVERGADGKMSAFHGSIAGNVWEYTGGLLE